MTQITNVVISVNKAGMIPMEISIARESAWNGEQPLKSRGGICVRATERIIHAIINSSKQRGNQKRKGKQKQPHVTAELADPGSRLWSFFYPQPTV